jgi:hypothetical protein
VSDCCRHDGDTNQETIKCSLRFALWPDESSCGSTSLHLSWRAFKEADSH